MTDLVIVTDDGPVRTVRMNRPEKKNALTMAMYDAMAAAIEGAGTRSGAALPADRRRADGVLRRQRHRRFPQDGDRRRRARGADPALPLCAGALRNAAGRRRARQRGRRRHHHADALRSCGRGERRALFHALRRPRPGAGSGFQPDRAAADGPGARVLAAGDGPAAERRRGESRGSGQYRRRGGGGRSRGDEGRARDRRLAAAGRAGVAPADARQARRDRRAHRRGSRTVQDPAAIGRGARRVRSLHDEPCGEAVPRDTRPSPKGRGKRVCLAVNDTSNLQRLQPRLDRLRLGSRNGGSTRLSPSLSSGSSTAKPGPSVAISNRMPFGSRK